jgi:hypothetical protein
MHLPLLPVSRRRRPYLLAALAILAVVIGLYVWLMAAAGTSARRDFDRIQPGMTLGEAQSVFSRPAEWTLERFSGIPFEIYTIRWTDDPDAGAEVIFDEVGKVVRKKYYFRHTPSLRDQARIWWRYTYRR